MLVTPLRFDRLQQAVAADVAVSVEVSVAASIAIIYKNIHRDAHVYISIRRPTQSIMYVPFQVNRFQKII